MTDFSTLVFVTGKLIGALLLPPLNLLLLAAAGLAVSLRHPAPGRRLTLLALAGLWLLSTPLLAKRMLGWVEAPCAPVTAGLAEAIVVLGGGVRWVAPEYGSGTLGDKQLERVRYAARVYRQTRVPVLVSGGSPDERPPEALLMRETLEQEFGVPVAWAEGLSRTTRENAAFSAPLLRQAGIRRLYLVTHAWHLPRATRAFEREGFTVSPAGMGCDSIQPFEWTDVLPAPQGLLTSHNAIHELVGEVWYWLLHQFM